MARTQLMLEIRDQINEHSVRGELLQDRERWHRVCTAMDVLSQGASRPDEVDAANCLGEEAPSVVAVTPGAGDQELEDALVAIRDGLRQRVQDAHRAFAGNPLESALPKDLGYAREKIAGVTGRDRVMAEAYLPVLQQAVERVREGLNRRGLEGDEFTADLLKLLSRVQSFLDSEPSSPSSQDMNLMALYAFPKLLDDLLGIVAEVDTNDASF